MDSTFLQDRIAATKKQIAAYEDAVMAISTGKAQSYTLDTGQDRTTVTKLDIRSLQITIDQLYNRLTMLEARLEGGSTTVVPAW